MSMNLPQVTIAKKRHIPLQVKLNQVLWKVQEETPLEAVRQVEEVSFGKAEDTFDPTSAGAGKQQMSGGASLP